MYTRAVKFLLVALSLFAAAAPTASASGDPVAALSLMSPKPVKPAKDFPVSAPDDRPLTLADFKGKVVFLNFWATWCKPCEEEMPGMERLLSEVQGQRAGRARDLRRMPQGAACCRPVREEARPHVPDRARSRDVGARARTAVWAVPSTFIIDRQGKRVPLRQWPRASGMARRPRPSSSRCSSRCASMPESLGVAVAFSAGLFSFPLPVRPAAFPVVSLLHHRDVGGPARRRGRRGDADPACCCTLIAFIAGFTRRLREPRRVLQRGRPVPARLPRVDPDRGRRPSS